jgi:Eco57I restriction-modification methylase/TaqI-like C-terminal specificity domain
VPAATKADSRARIEALVERFSANEAHYVSAGFDETSTREQFINGLFDALGWDVLDVQGRGADREVVFHPRLQDDPRVAGAEEWDEDLTEDELAAREPVARIPDYAFRHEGSTRFFVEAKRAGANLDARAPAFQVKSYAWSHRVRVAVLSNFRELRVFEALTRPEYGNPRGGLMNALALNYQQYVERWDDIWNLLSREAVAGGSIERTARYRRGVVRVDEAFLNELTEWRAALARDLVQRNEDLDRWELAEATQRILDRLIFLRVCEDRTLEQDVVLRRYARRTDSYHQLQTEMRRLDAIYNGVLFAPHFSERLELSDEVIQRFIERLYYPYSPYRFDVIDVDLLGAVYERFLGTEITLDGRRRVRMEEKPEVRHAGGVYYTPPWVVREIVEGCLGPLLEGRTPRTAEGLRIVDPACGSGSFLLGALDFLIDWHEQYYAANPNVDPGQHYAVGDGCHRLTSSAKAGIVSRNLYGVDIDPQAVEVAQMSLYLKILEAETGASLHEQQRLFPGPFLPSLTQNVRSGNSLLSPDDVPGQLLLDEELRHRINPFDWYDDRRGFGDVFRERGGFDAVIGNPPYTRVQVLSRYRREEAQLYLRAFETAEAGYDIATLFVERGLSLLRGPRGRDRGGRLGFIVTRTFCETDAGEPLRRLLSARNHIAEIVDFGSGTVFEEVSAYTLLLFLTREPNTSYRLTRVPPPPSPAALTFARGVPELNATLSASTLTEEPWDLLLPSEQKLLDRLAEAHPPLRQVSGDSIFQGVVTGADLVFRCRDAGPNGSDLRRVIPLSLAESSAPIDVEREVLRPVVAGSNDLHRFRREASNVWLILPYEASDSGRYRALGVSEFRRRYPRAFEWLSRNEAQLRERTRMAENVPWDDENWILFSRRQNLELFPEPKVLVPYMIKELTAVADESGAFFVNVTTGGYGVGLDADYGITRDYIAALLNSELLSWVLRRYSRAWRGNYYGARKRNLARLPIAIPEADEQQAVVNGYSDCVGAAAALDSARSDHDRESLARIYDSAVDRFDRLIFDLYEITPDEVRVIRSM